MTKYNLASETSIFVGTLVVFIMALGSGWWHSWPLEELARRLISLIITPIVTMITITLFGVIGGVILEWFAPKELTMRQRTEHDEFIIKIINLCLILGFWFGLILDLFIVIVPIP